MNWCSSKTWFTSNPSSTLERLGSHENPRRTLSGGGKQGLSLGTHPAPPAPRKGTGQGRAGVGHAGRLPVVFIPSTAPPGKVPRKLLLHKYVTFLKSIQCTLGFISQQPDKSGEELREQLDTGVSTSPLGLSVWRTGTKWLQRTRTGVCPTGLQIQSCRQTPVYVWWASLRSTRVSKPPGNGAAAERPACWGMEMSQLQPQPSKPSHAW